MCPDEETSCGAEWRADGFSDLLLQQRYTVPDGSGVKLVFTRFILIMYFDDTIMDNYPICLFVDKPNGPDNADPRIATFIFL